MKINVYYTGKLRVIQSFHSGFQKFREFIYDFNIHPIYNFWCRIQLIWILFSPSNKIRSLESYKSTEDVMIYNYIIRYWTLLFLESLFFTLILLCLSSALMILLCLKYIFQHHTVVSGFSVCPDCCDTITQTEAYEAYSGRFISRRLFKLFVRENTFVVTWWLI